MVLHKHHHHAGKRGGAGAHKTTGVADYFAVLGMHLVVDDDRPSSSSSSNDDNGRGDDAQNFGADDGDRRCRDDEDGNCDAANAPPSSAACDGDGGGGGGGGDDSTSSSSLSQTEDGRNSARTPRNSRNLSRKFLAHAVIDDGGGTSTDAAAGAVDVGVDDEEERLARLFHEERFHREIVELALTSSPATLTNDDESKCWTLVREADLPIIIPRGKDPTAKGGRSVLGTMTTVQLAYRRRRSQQLQQQQRRIFDDDYTPGVADVSIQYVKIRPSTIIIPPNDDKMSSNARNAIFTTTTTTTTESMDGAASNANSSGGSGSGGGGGAAKQLSSLARHGMELLTAAAVNYAMQKKGRREHFFPEDDDRCRDASASAGTRSAGAADVRGAPQCRGASYEEDDDGEDDDGVVVVVRRAMREFLHLPSGYDEWIVPDFCEMLHLPTTQRRRRSKSRQRFRPPPILIDRTHVAPSASSPTTCSRDGDGIISPSSVGMEAMYLSPMMMGGKSPQVLLEDADQSAGSLDPDFVPILAPIKSIPKATSSFKTASTTNNNAFDMDEKDGGNVDDAHIYIPILAIRRQRIGDEERYHEDPSIVDVHVTYLDDDGQPPKMMVNNEDDDDGDGDDDFCRGRPSAMTSCASVLNKSGWTPSSFSSLSGDALDDSCSSTDVASQGQAKRQSLSGRPVILLRRNIPNGFADVPIAPAKVLDRFPRKNYRGMPFPEEELPLFCYPRGGVYLVRDKLRHWSLPKSFGFVVKNERGDSIYVSCLSFMEPLSKQRRVQLDRLSIKRRDTSLAHRAFCEKKARTERQGGKGRLGKDCLVGFDDIVAFENKTICLLGRYPYWTQFKRFLTHLHLLSGSSSDIPLERNISHLLLSVPIPKPGGQCVLVPFSTMNEPMAFVMPPLKDLPLVDLSYARLFGALDVPTVVTIVLGFLCLERKVILISTRQSLLLDCCELLKSLLFPFELCAPYVPHLTQPFMSCLEFPGATFVGIHDDGEAHGLARTVRLNIPEDSIIVELDTGEINCDKNRQVRVSQGHIMMENGYETLKAAYHIIPIESRTILIKEVETLCQDAGIVPGQEPLDCGIDSVIDSTVPFSMEVLVKKKKERREPLDERAVRDSFLRFFTANLVGYERFLVVPDADFLISGNDWFDSSKFVATASPSRTPFLRALVETQLFQSFVQRRTEASDLHCVLFDECLAEYHSSNFPYGRLCGNVNLQLQRYFDNQRQMDYDLLVDQCATEPDLCLDDDESSVLARSDVNKSVGNDNDTATLASSGYAESTISDPSLDKDTPFAINSSGDIVTCPSTLNLPTNARFAYCVDGNGFFPTAFDRNQFFPMEPQVLETESPEAPAPILTRSEREREEAIRLFNMTVSRRGMQKQHRCLWQMAKFMGSQFFGAYILCIPSQISQPNLSVSEKSKILLRSLGALRTLRSHRRIVADEAAYRALIVACGRCGTDRRTEITKLYGLMRMDGIFMNAVTLGCYTRAIAEGYSNVHSVDGGAKVGMQVILLTGNNRSMHKGLDLEVLDSNLSSLEESGVRWRSGGNADSQANHVSSKLLEQDRPLTISPSKTFDTANTQRSRTKRSWLPVNCSSSFTSHFQSKNRSDTNGIRLFALWSRATSCKACGYIPLDEEIQSGWDVISNKLENSSSVACPRCTGSMIPLIGYKEMSIVELIESKAAEKCSDDLDVSGLTQDVDPQEMPPQLESSIKGGRIFTSTVKQGQAGFVTYLSPQKLRIMLEDLFFEYGEDALNRDSLRVLNPEVFFNLWWYSARFSLPLPLSVKSLPDEEDKFNNSGIQGDGKEPNNPDSCCDCCAFASWDKTVALYGCQSAAKAIVATQTLSSKSDRLLREKLFDNPYTDIPLLSFFNLQSYAQSDWDHPDFSEILVALVKACETRDLLPVIECVFQRNHVRRALKQINSSTSLNNLSFESASTTTFSLGTSTEASLRPTAKELECYRTILYLARYQCTTAFHAFFPTTTRPCKGYHFWCAQGTAPLPIFDRAFREAADTYGKREKMLVPIPEISGVALGFRSVFGHII